jgi:hypothetical protein
LEEIFLVDLKRNNLTQQPSSPWNHPDHGTILTMSPFILWVLAFLTMAEGAPTVGDVYPTTKEFTNGVASFFCEKRQRFLDTKIKFLQETD